MFTILLGRFCQHGRSMERLFRTMAAPRLPPPSGILPPSPRYSHGFCLKHQMQAKACGIDSTPLSVFNFYFGCWPARINSQISTMSQTGEMCHEHGSRRHIDQIVWRKDHDDNWSRTSTIFYFFGSCGSAITKEASGASVQPPPRLQSRSFKSFGSDEFRLTHKDIFADKIDRVKSFISATTML